MNEGRKAHQRTEQQNWHFQWTRKFHEEWKCENFVSNGRNNAEIKRMFLSWSSKLADFLQSNSCVPEVSQGKKIKEGLRRRWIKEIVDSSVSVYDL